MQEFIKSSNPDLAEFRKCVGAVVLQKNNSKKVLVAQRIDAIGDYWQMPQGGIEEGEDYIKAALRETKEELGLEENQLELIDSLKDWLCYKLPESLAKTIWDGRFIGQAQKWVIFQEKEKDAIQKLRLNFFDIPEFAAWKWIDVKHLPDIAIPFKKAIYTKIADHLTKESL